MINTTAGMGGDLYLDPDDPTGFAEGTDLVSGIERLAHVEELLPGHLHARLRQPELRRGQPGLRQHPGHAARRARSGSRSWACGRAGDLRHRAPVVRQQAGRRGPDRRPADVPAVHGHPVRRSAPIPLLLAAMVAQVPARRGVGVVRARARCRCRGWRSRCCSAGTCGSAWRTTSTSAGATRPPTPQLVATRVTIIAAMGAEVATPDEAPRDPRAASPDEHDRLASAPDEVRTVACVGAGVIGGGWVAYFLARGFAVRAWDPAPDAEARLRAPRRRGVAGAHRAGAGAGRERGPPDRRARPRRRRRRGRLRAGERARAAGRSSGSLLAAIDAATPEHVVIASSTSGFGMTRDGGRGADAAPAGGGPSVQPAVPDPAGRGRRRREDRGRRRDVDRGVLPAHRQVRDHHGSRGARVHRQPAAGGAVAGGAAHGGRTGRRRSSRSTRRSPTARACAGRSTGRCSPSTSPAGRAAWRTCSTTSDRRCSRRGPGWPHPTSPPSCATAWCAAATDEAGSRSIADLVRERDRALVDLLRVLGKVPRAGAAMPEPLTWAEDVRPEWIDYNGHLSEALLRAGVRARQRRRDGRARHDVGLPGRDGHVALHARGARPLPRPGAARARGWTCVPR